MVIYFVILLFIWPTSPNGGKESGVCRTHEAIIQGAPALQIELVFRDAANRDAHKPYQVDIKPTVAIRAKNNTDQRVTVVAVDTYYQNRPRLIKDGKVVPYREEIKRLVRSKDADPEFVRLPSAIVVEPYSSTEIEDLNLSDWYGNLEAGSYKLTNRHRFEVEGAWSAESAEISFELVSKK